MDFVKKLKPDHWSSAVLVVLMALSGALVLERFWIQWRVGPGPAIGSLAPEVSGTTLSGTAWRLEGERGHVVLLDFWATWCPPCLAAMPTLEKVHKMYEGKGLRVVGINVEPGHEDDVRAYLKRNGVTFPSVVDTGPITTAYGVATFPHSFLIGRDGRILVSYQGPSTERRLRADIEQALGQGG